MIETCTRSVRSRASLPLQSKEATLLQRGGSEALKHMQWSAPSIGYHRETTCMSACILDIC